MRRLACFLVITCSSSLWAQVNFTNPGFETASGGAPAFGGSFAGGTFVNLNTSGSAISNWTLAAAPSGNTDRWVQSTAAHGGNRYLYLSASIAFPNDDCLRQGPFTSVPGQRWRFGMWTAGADTDATPNSFNFEIEEVIGGVTQPAIAYVITTPANPAWSDTGLSVIPWQFNVIEHTFSPGATSFNFYASAQRVSGTGNSSVVFDDLTFTVAVPEPSTVIMIIVSGLSALAMVYVGWKRRHQAREALVVVPE